MKICNVLFATQLAAVVMALEKLTPEKLVSSVSRDRLKDTLENLEDIANANGGNCAFGLPGYEASMDLVLERLASATDYFETHVQPFNYIFSTTYNIRVLGPDGELEDIETVENNSPTPLPGGSTGPLVALPIDDEHGSAEKLKIATEKGALGVLVFNNVSGPDIEYEELSEEAYGSLVPTALITLEQGLAWKSQVEANKTVEVTLIVNSTVEDRETWQIIADTKQGDPDNVVMLGAHLDSVQEGPGINDNGSGTAALLELAGAMQAYEGLNNKVRFAWWGAEESGLIGSDYYVSHLSEKETDKIRFYVNFDMIASPKPRYYVHVDDDDDKTGGHFLYDYLLERGFSPLYEPFDDESDYVAFIEAGIPPSGLFTGAGDPYDTCYHESCDDIDNVNLEAITINTQAAAYALAKLALSVDGTPPREKST